jgi:hypothetical protein
MSFASRMIHLAVNLALQRRLVSGVFERRDIEHRILSEARRATGSAAPSTRGRRPARWILGVTLAIAAVVSWLAPRSAPPGQAIPAILNALRLPGFVAAVPKQRPPRPKMHVADVVPTDATFREPARAFNDGPAHWRVAIRDVQERPVVGARVHVDIIGPDGVRRARLVMMTDSDGLALFTHSLGAAEMPGVYTVRVADVSHANRRDVVYDRAANTAWSTSFSVNNPSRR